MDRFVRIRHKHAVLLNKSMFFFRRSHPHLQTINNHAFPQNPPKKNIERTTMKPKKQNIPYIYKGTLAWNPFQKNLNIGFVWICCFLPTCQVRVVRFYVSWPIWPAASSSYSSASSSSTCSLQALDRSVPRRTQTASPGSECSLPDLNCMR